MSVVSELDIVETDCERRPLFNFARVNCTVKLVDHLRLKRALSVLDVVNRSFDNIKVYIYWVYKARLNIACSHLFVFCFMVRFRGVLTESVKRT